MSSFLFVSFFVLPDVDIVRQGGKVAGQFSVQVYHVLNIEE